MALWKYIKYRAAHLLYGIDELDEKERAIIIEASDLFVMRPDKAHLSRQEKNFYREYGVDTLEKFERRCNYENVWRRFIQTTEISEELFLKFPEQFGWDNVCIYQTLSEKFIRKYKDKLDWGSVCLYQKFSEKFIEEFKNYIDWNALQKNCKIKFSEKFKAKFARELGPIIIHFSDRPDIKMEFMEFNTSIFVGNNNCINRYLYNVVSYCSYPFNKRGMPYVIAEMSMDKKEIWVE